MMAAQYREHPETGERLMRRTRPATVRYKGHETIVDLPGWYPEGDGDGIVNARDMRVLDRALNGLKAAVDDVPAPDEVRRIRRRLGLTQRLAGDLLGGGARAFQKYEAGDVVVSRPMANLLRLLDRDPSRLAELRASTDIRQC